MLLKLPVIAFRPQRVLAEWHLRPNESIITWQVGAPRGQAGLLLYNR